jgi:hypothetical protein
MGREAKTAVDDGATRAEARLHLDSETLTIGPPFRLKLRLDAVDRCVVGEGGFEIASGPAQLSIALSAKDAAAWAKAILNPPSLATKLGLKPGLHVAAIGALPAEVAALLPEAGRHDRLPKTIDAPLILAMVPAALPVKDLGKLRTILSPGAAAWLIYEKGVTNGDRLILAARAAGLKDTKVAKISDRFAALRFIAAG